MSSSTTILDFAGSWLIPVAGYLHFRRLFRLVVCRPQRSSISRCEIKVSLKLSTPHLHLLFNGTGTKTT
jgi:hypothetical protein